MDYFYLGLGFLLGITVVYVGRGLLNFLADRRIKQLLKDKRVNFYHSQLQGALYNYHNALENAEVSHD